MTDYVTESSTIVHQVQRVRQVRKKAFTNGPRFRTCFQEVRIIKNLEF